MDAVVKELKKRGQVHPAELRHLHRAQDQGAQGAEPAHRRIDQGEGRQDRALQGLAVAEEVGLISHTTPITARPGFGVLVVALGTLVVPFDSSVNFRLSVHHARVRIADPGNPMGGDRLHAHLRRADAGVRPRRRHAGLPAHLPRRQPVECRRLRAVRDGAKLRRIAGRARAAGRRRRTGAELRTGAGDQPASGDRAHARPRHLYHGDRPRRRAGAAGRRSAGAADRLARGVLVPRAARAVGVPAGLAAARRHAARAPRALRCRRRRPAGAGDQRDAAGTQPVAAHSEARGVPVAALACVLAIAGFIVQERRTQRPIIDLALLPRLRLLAAERRTCGAEPGGILGAAAGAVLSEPLRRTDRHSRRACCSPARPPAPSWRHRSPHG